MVSRKMPDGPRQRVDVPAYARVAHDGLPQRKTGRRTSAESTLIPQDTLPPHPTPTLPPGGREAEVN